MAKKFLSDADFGGVARVVGLLDPTSAQDAATKAYVDGLAEGLAWKDNVRTASTGNVNLASPGANIDGVAMAVSDRVLLKDQTAPAENGIYIWNGAAVAMARSNDANSADELESAVVTVDEGTVNADTTWRQDTVNLTLGTTAISWLAFGTGVAAASETVAGKAELATQAETDTGTDDARIVTPLKLKTSVWVTKRYVANFGDGSATQYDLSHNLSTRDVQVEVYRNSSPWDTVMCDISRLDVNTVRLNFAVAPTTNQYRCVVVY